MRPRLALLSLALAVAACQQPQAVVDTTVAPGLTAEPAPPAPSPPTCAAIDFEVLHGQWPDPQFVELGEHVLFGGGFSSISTGRFGSASWEHCETLVLIDEEPGPLPVGLAGLMDIEDRGDCRIPDFALGGRLFDFDWFQEVLPGHDIDTVTQKVGWKPARTFGDDTFYFHSVDVWTEDGWQRRGFPRDGFYSGWSQVVMGDDLLLAGGVRELGGGKHVSVGQTAILKGGEKWVYTAWLHRARHDHLLLATESGAVAVGGSDDGGAVATVEQFDRRANQWTVLQEGPPIEWPIGTRWSDTIFVAERVEREATLSRFARIDAGRSWAWLSPPESLVKYWSANTLLAHPAGPLLITPERIELYDTRADEWTTCEVSRELDEHPIEGKGDGSWGPAHLTGDGRVFLTRIDRERYYDFDE